jgi:hypothetical protein
MGGHKRHYCKFTTNGCSCTVLNLQQMKTHETKCGYDPEKQVEVLVQSAVVQAAAAPLQLSMQTIIRRLGKLERAQTLTLETIANLEQRCKDLSNILDRLLPNYDHIKLVHLHLPRHIMEVTGGREFCESFKKSCRHQDPKHAPIQFMKHLVKCRPLFYKLKRFDTIVGNVAFYHKKLTPQGEIPLRQFVVHFLNSLVPLLKTVWSDDKVNKEWFVPEAILYGYSEKLRHRIERQKRYSQAQWMFQNRIQVTQDYNALVRDCMTEFRNMFTDAVEKQKIVDKAFVV